MPSKTRWSYVCETQRAYITMEPEPMTKGLEWEKENK